MQITIPTPSVEGTFALLKSIGDWVVSIYEHGPKWMAWVALGVGVLVYFGLFSLPVFSSKDTALESQFAVLSKKLDTLSSDINGLSIKVDTLKDMGPVLKKKK